MNKGVQAIVIKKGVNELEGLSLMSNSRIMAQGGGEIPGNTS